MVSKSRLDRLARIRRRGITPRRAATQDRLLESAAALIAEAGVGATTVEQICLEAGFSRGAFYSNFKDKNELVVELLRRHGEELIEGVQTARAHLSEVLQQVRAEGKAGIASGCAVEGEFSDVDNPQARQALAAIADHWLASFPMETQDYLLRAELSLHAIRDEIFRPHLKAFLTDFQEEVANFLGDALSRVGRTTILPLHEVATLMINLVEESFEQPLIGRQPTVELEHLSEQLLLPVLEALTRVAEDSISECESQFRAALTWGGKPSAR